MSKKIFLIDGSGFIFRAFYAIPELHRTDGVNVNALFGFINMLLKLIESVKDAKICVLFDAKRKNFRHEIYSEYKSNRLAMPDELAVQIPMIKNFCELMGFFNVVMDGFEADDLIASYCEHYKNQDNEVIVVSSDKDLLQLLIYDNVKIYEPNRQKFLTQEDVILKFGVMPDKIAMLQALAGDSSDNVPGAPGIAVKTAAILINQFGDLESILHDADKITQNKRRESIVENKDLILTSYELVKLKKDIVLSEITGGFKPHKKDLAQFLLDNNFTSIIKRHKKDLDLPDVISNVEKNTLQRTRSEHVCIKDLYIHAKIHGRVAFYFCVTENEVNVYLSTIKDQKFLNCKIFNIKTIIDDIDVLSNILSNPSIVKITANLKEQLHILSMLVTKNQRSLDDILLEQKEIDDVLTMSYVLYNGKNKHDLENLFFEKIGIDLTDAILEKQAVIKNEIFKFRMNYLYHCIEIPILIIAYKMEKTGFLIDQNYLKDISLKLDIEIKKTEKEIFILSGEEFNIASSKQLSKILFEKLSLPVPQDSKKGKSGVEKTDVNVLNQLEDSGIEIAHHILKWRHLSKLRSTYTTSLLDKTSSSTGRLHTKFLTNYTLTGRFSSRDPNLQNIPIKDSGGLSIRKAFICDEDKMLVSLDYSQIELRILAHIANIDILINAFKNAQDIHETTARQIFNVDDINNEQRNMAKTINFSIIYGISPYGLAKQLKISNKQAKEYIDAYFLKYPGIKEYIDQTLNQAKEFGFVKTILNRKCHIKDILSKNHTLRSLAQRQAVNAPIQGSAAELMKKAMILIDKNLILHKDVQMLLQVHDEIILEVPKSIDKKHIYKWQNIMENALPFSIPIKVKIKISNSWE